MTDFFCKVHNDIGGRKHPENIKHIVYEQKFQNRLDKQKIDELREKYLNELDEIFKIINDTSLEQFIKLKHKEYIKKISKCRIYGARKVDLEYSYGMALIVASYVVSEILRKE